MHLLFSCMFWPSRPTSGIPSDTWWSSILWTPCWLCHLPACLSKYPTFLLDTVWNAKVVWGLKKDALFGMAGGGNEVNNATSQIRTADEQFCFSTAQLGSLSVRHTQNLARSLVTHGRDNDTLWKGWCNNYCTYCGNGAAMTGRSVLQTLMEMIETQMCFPNCLRKKPQRVIPQPTLLIFPSLVYNSITIYAGRRRVRRLKFNITLQTNHF
jgi:hypothetical protein